MVKLDVVKTIYFPKREGYRWVTVETEYQINLHNIMQNRTKKRFFGTNVTQGMSLQNFQTQRHYSFLCFEINIVFDNDDEMNNTTRKK